MSNVFLDTSAILSLLFRELDAETVQAKLNKCSRILSSRLMQIEVQLVLLSLALDKPELQLLSYMLESDSNSFLSQVDVFQMTELVCRLAGQMVPKVRLRSLDAIHQARRGLPDLELLTLDERLNEAFSLLG